MLEIEEGPRVLGLGLGLFLLILLWSFILLITLVCSRLSAGAGSALASVAGILTMILLAIPRHPPKFVDDTAAQTAVPDSDEEVDLRIYDHAFVWRLVLLVVMVTFCTIGLSLFICVHCMETVYHQPLKKLKTS